MKWLIYGRIAPARFIQWIDHICGRFLIDPDDPELMALRLALPSYRNIATGEVYPSDEAVVLAGFGQGAKQARPLASIWGFPRHRENLSYNARVETLHLHLIYQRYLGSLPLAIPTSGLLGWRSANQADGRYLLRLPGKPILYLAGFGASVRRTPGGRAPERFTVLTRESSPSMNRYYHRMPVVLREEELADWLSGEGVEDILYRENPELEPVQNSE